MAWTADDIDIVLDDDGTEDDVVTACIDCPAGRYHVMAEVRVAQLPTGRRLELYGLHMHGEAVRPNELGPRRLFWLVNAILEAMEFDEVLIVGATRTTGANPGHRPRELRFQRRRRSPPGASVDGDGDAGEGADPARG